MRQSRPEDSRHPKGVQSTQNATNASPASPGTMAWKECRPGYGAGDAPPLSFSSNDGGYPICGVWMDWRTPTDRNMQQTFCPVAQATDTNPVVWDYPDGMGGPRGYPVDNRTKPSAVEGFCGSCRAGRRAPRSNEGFCASGACSPSARCSECITSYTSRSLGTRYNYQ